MVAAAAAAGYCTVRESVVAVAGEVLAVLVARGRWVMRERADFFSLVGRRERQIPKIISGAREQEMGTRTENEHGLTALLDDAKVALIDKRSNCNRYQVARCICDSRPSTY